MLEEQYKKALELIDSSGPLEVPQGFDRPLKEEDFIPYIHTCEARFEQLITIFNDKSNKNEISDTEKNKLISNALILSGEHSSKNLWTTDNSVILSGKLINTILSREKTQNIDTLITNNNQKLFKIILDTLRPYLLQSTWKKYPASVVCYAWIIKHVKSPFLGDYLNKVLPTSLIITDDFESKNRLTGLACIRHIIVNVTKAEMTMYNFHNVIIEALRPILYDKSSDTIYPMIITYVDLMNKLNPQYPVADLSRNNFDDIFDIILKNMYLEQNIQYRTTYIECLPLLIKAKGLTTLRHGNLIFKILEEYILESSSSALALEALVEVLKVGWPRKKWIFESTMKILLKLIYKYTKNRPELSSCMIVKLKSIMATLSIICPDDVKSLLEVVKKEEAIDDFYITLLSFFPQELVNKI